LGLQGFRTAKNQKQPTLSEEDKKDDCQHSSVELNQNLSPTAGSIPSGCLGDEKLAKSVLVSGRFARFSERSVGKEGVRSMYSQRLSSNQHRHMEVQLRVSRRRNDNLENTWLWFV
jgi:hypothetical protein